MRSSAVNVGTITIRKSSETVSLGDDWPMAISLLKYDRALSGKSQLTFRLMAFTCFITARDLRYN